MEAIKLQTHIGSDGILKLEVPLDIVNEDVEIVLVMQRVEQTDVAKERADWLAFIDATAGSFADDPLERGEQGVYEVRDEL